MKPLTLEDIAKRVDVLRDELAHVIRVLEEKPERVYAFEPMTVSASEAAKILGVKRDVIYDYHRDGTLNGFRPTPNAHLKFLASDVRALALQMAAERRNA